MIADFLAPCLNSSVSYDRAAGFFSSSLFILAPATWADFFLKNGRMRLLCSVELTPSDSSYLRNDQSSKLDLRQEFARTWAGLSRLPRGELTARLMRSLIHHSRLELRVATFRKTNGLFHDKIGIFSDAEGNQVSFTGSANESWNAWSGRGNHESVDIFRSWVAEDSLRVQNHTDRFHSYWESEVEELNVFQGADLIDVIMDKEPEEDIELVVNEVRAELEEALPKLKSRNTSSSVSERKELRDYQLHAVENWFRGGSRGIISFATGGGKTITALEIVNRWAADGGYALVLVPTEILVSQWIREARSYLKDPQILRADSNSSTSWQSAIRAFLRPAEGREVRFVVSTYATASTRKFASLISGDKNLLVIGDEVHRFGAEKTRQIAESLSAGGRLGLSATPLRTNDEEGTEAVLEYFGQTIEPIYTLRQAIKDKNLVPYKFSCLDAHLSEDEQEKWDEYSRRIATLIPQANKDKSLAVKLRDLLIARARVSKLAQSKIHLTVDCLEKNYSQGDRWLVYCETTNHISEIEQAIRLRMPGVTVMRYVSTNEDEHERVLAHFSDIGGILLAIKCLDEGVDIPIINKAIIVSSSQTPREFIQRRGRVLRKANNKHLAELYDFLMFDSNGEVLMLSDLERLVEFAVDALNQGPYIRLNNLKEKLNQSGGGKASE